jgi:hypothetical protein
VGLNLEEGAFHGLELVIIARKGRHVDACCLVRLLGLGIRVQGSGFRVQGSGFSVYGKSLGLRAYGLGLRV